MGLAVFNHTKGIYSPKHCAPWWNEECSSARAQKRRAKRRLRRHNSIKNLCAYKKATAFFKRTVRRTKREYWRDFCSKLSAQTPIDRVWKTFNSIKGRTPPCNFPLSDNTILTPQEKSHLMGNFFHSIVGNKIVLPHENILQEEIEAAIKKKGGDYNKPFSRSELDYVLNSLQQNKATGPDDIPYEFLKHLPENCLIHLLYLSNYSFAKGLFMAYLKNCFLLPFLKGNKDPSIPESYRPISLLSTIGKVIEKLVHNRLYWYLETHELLPPTQAGFRRNRSTIDQLARLEHCIQCGLKEKRVVLVTYFDISKAFEQSTSYSHPSQIGQNGDRGKLTGLDKKLLGGKNIPSIHPWQSLKKVQNRNRCTTRGHFEPPTLFSFHE